MCSSQPDRGHRVEAGLRHVAVVAIADLGQVGQALVGDPVLPPRRLLLRERDADGLHLPGGVADHSTPTRNRHRATGRPASGVASRTPAGACSPAPPPASRPGAGSRRRCRSSTGQEPTRRTCWTRRSGGGSPPRHGFGCGASLLRCGASGQRFLRRRCYGLEVLEPDRPDDVGEHARRRPRKSICSASALSNS